MSDKDEEITFHHYAHDALSNVSGLKLYENEEHYRLLRTEKLHAKPPNEILAAQDCPPDFDFLSLDVEGYDERVIKALDLERFRPRFIVVEAHVPDLRMLDQHPIVSALTRYVPIAAHEGNLFLRRT